MSTQTTSLISVRLPTCLSAVVIDYFGRARFSIHAAQLGQYEDCCDHIHQEKLVLYGACRGGHIDIVTLCFSQTEDINTINIGLENACMGNHIDVIKLLIAHGANAWDRGLLFACQHGSKQAAELMIARGATMLNLGLAQACQGGHREIVKLLIASGATECVCTSALGCYRPMAEHLE